MPKTWHETPCPFCGALSAPLPDGPFYVCLAGHTFRPGDIGVHTREAISWSRPVWGSRTIRLTMAPEIKENDV